MAIHMQQRRDTALNWVDANPVLGDGELGLETDTRKLKCGDGVRDWLQLPYLFPNLPVAGTTGQVLAKTTNADYDTTWETLTATNTGADPAGAAAAAQTAAEAASLQKAANLGDVANAGTSRTNLGLGSAATHAATDFDASGAAATAQTTAEAYTDTQVAPRALDSAVVHNTGNETVTGTKTFSAAPAVPDGSFTEAKVANLASDLAGKAPIAGPFAPSSTGATAASRYVGATASGAPVSGTFAKGDFVIDQTATAWVCTVAGSPGTWSQITAAGAAPSGAAGGDLTGSYPSPTLATSGATAGSAGDATHVPAVTVDAKGRVTAGPTSTAIALAASGDATGTLPGALTLATANSAPGTTGDATHTSVVTTDAKGRVTANTSTAIQVAESQVTGLSTDLAAKLAAASNLSDVANAATSRTNLGLGSAATHAATDFDTSGAATTAQTTAEAYTDTQIAAKGFPWFNVKTYGAVGNGTTDDSAAIQAAINACDPNRGGTVYFPQALGYYCATGLTVPYGVALVGEAMTGMSDELAKGSVRIIVGDGQWGLTIALTTDTAQYFGSRVEGIHLYEKNAGMALGGIRIGHSNNCQFYRVAVGRFTAGTGILVDGGAAPGRSSQYHSFLDCRVGTCNVGVDLKNFANGARFTNCIIDGNHNIATAPPTGTVGIRVDNASDHLHVVGCDIQGWDVLCELGGAAAYVQGRFEAYRTTGIHVTSTATYTTLIGACDSSAAGFPGIGLTIDAGAYHTDYSGYLPENITAVNKQVIDNGTASITNVRTGKYQQAALLGNVVGRQEKIDGVGNVVGYEPVYDTIAGVALVRDLSGATNNATGIGSLTRTLTVPVKAGDWVLIGGGYGSSSTPTITVTDSKSNTYTVQRHDDKTTGGTPHSFVASAPITTGLAVGDTITVSFSSNVNYPLFYAYEYTGIASGTFVDQTVGATGTGTAISSGNATTTADYEFMFAAYCIDNTTGVSDTVGTGFTLLDHDATSAKAASFEVMQLGTAGTYPATATINTSRDWACSAITIKKAPGGTGPAGATGTAGGDLTGTYPNPTLVTANASPGTTGDATHTSAVTTDAKGRVTANTATAIQIAESQVTGLTTDLAAKLAAASNLSDLGSAASARASAGLNIDAITTVADVNKTAAATDRIVAYTSLSAARTVTLPAANAVNAGQWVIVADYSNSATATNTISVAAAGSDTIVNNQAIASAGGSRRLISDGTSKWILEEATRLRASANLSDVQSASTARTNLGLGAAALLADPIGVTHGGTGQTGQTAGFDALAPNTTKGDVVVHNGTNNVRVGVGTNNWVLTADSAQTAGVKWAAVSAGSLTSSSNYVSGSDVTMTTAGTYYDGPSLTLAAGTYLLVGQLLMVGAASGTRTWTLKLWDGTTIVTQAVHVVEGTAATAQNTVPVVGLVSPGGSTTYKISATSTVNSDKIAQQAGQGSCLLAVKIA